MHTQTITALILFIAGSLMHTLAQIDAIARAKNNPVNSRWQLFASRWPTIMNRGFWSLGFFALWLEGQLVAVLVAMHIALPAFATGILDLHISGAVAWMAGYLSDSALAFVPLLSTSIPPPIDKPQPTSQGNGPLLPPPPATA